MKIMLDRNGLRAVRLFAARCDIRYYLNGVKVEATKDATRLVATNGHVLGMYHTASENDLAKPTEAILPLHVMNIVRKVKGDLFPVWIESADGLAWTLTDTSIDYTIGFKAIEGKFPDCQRVIPETVTGEAGFYNPAYLGLVEAAAKVFQPRHPTVSIGQNGAKGAALATIPGANGFLAVIMPMGGASVVLTRPKWADSRLIPSPVPASTEAAAAVPA